MAMVCPQCNSSFEQRLQCPSCGVRLLYQGASRAGGATGHWQQTPWGRILVGLMLAQGLYYGLRQLCTAGLLAAGDDAARGIWTTLSGLVMLQGLQVVGLLVGGVLAGAGQRQGVVFGAVVGVWNGVISVVVLQGNAQFFTAVTLYGQPILQTAFGALGGFLGMLIWKPLPNLTPPAVAPRKNAPAAVALRNTPSRLNGPVAWGRVLAGVALAVGGTLWANVILDLVLQASEGKLTVDSYWQAQLVTWEIRGLALLAGSALAGATTANFVKQGLCVGLGAGVVLIGLRLGGKGGSVDELLLLASSALALGMVGGWFGGQLFPSVPAFARRRHLGPASA